MRFLVLDTSAFEGGLPEASDFSPVITPGVLRELERRGRLAAAEPLIDSGAIAVMEPGDSDVEAVRSRARSVGDERRLSGVDVEVLAVAHMLAAGGNAVRILTDDISIQNVATSLGIPASGSIVGHRRAINWIYYCPGCGASFENPPADSTCPICGTALRRKPRSRENVHKTPH
ncbi:MAG: hypothetical protein RXP97_02675 [Nitrososphaeria archaeon]|jgi:rRNA maturation endonuclease Nob1